MILSIYVESIQAIGYDTATTEDPGSLGSSAQVAAKGCPAVAHLSSGRRGRFEQCNRQTLERLPANRHSLEKSL